MPELPEVETVKRGLTKLLKLPARIETVEKSGKSLRFKYPRGLLKSLSGQQIMKIDRRAKYLLIHLGDKVLVNHLGMTGNWRDDGEFDPKRHDHIRIRFSDGTQLIYNDVRRFGYFDLIAEDDLDRSKWFQHLGPEPIDDSWSATDFITSLRGRKSAIKTAIMNQEVVVGVGNIYASEALFRAGISPKTRCHRISQSRYVMLHHAIREVLMEAIESGGSTIKDFKNAGGSSGYFQTKFFVYDRAGQLCKTCDEPIRSTVLSGRSTYWCPKCQS